MIKRGRVSPAPGYFRMEIYLLIIIVLLEGIILGHLFFIRRNPEDLIREQNKLLAKILENQSTTSVPQVVIQQMATTSAPTVETSEEAPPFEMEDSIPFIPRAAKAEASMGSGIETSASKFNSGDVEKLRKAKLEAQNRK